MSFYDYKTQKFTKFFQDDIQNKTEYKHQLSKIAWKLSVYQN